MAFVRRYRRWHMAARPMGWALACYIALACCGIWAHWAAPAYSDTTAPSDTPAAAPQTTEGLLWLTTANVGQPALVQVEDNPLVATFEHHLAEGDSATRMVPLAQLVRWGSLKQPPSQSLPHWHLVGGSLLVARLDQLNDEQITVRHRTLGRLELPLPLVRGVVFQPPSNEEQHDRLIARLFDSPASGSTTRPGDRVLLANGDELHGLVEALTPQQLTLKAPLGRVTIGLERVVALAFDPALLTAAPTVGKPPASSQDTAPTAATTPPLRLMVGLADGSRVLVDSLTLGQQPEQGSEAGPATTPGEASLKNQASLRPWRITGRWSLPAVAVTFLQPMGGEVTYLSDLEPESYRHLPYLDVQWPYRHDRSVIDTQLRAAGEIYLKGVAMHSASRLTYRLDRPYRKLAASLAIDDSTAGGGSVTFRVFVGNEQRYESPPIRGGMKPLPIEIDITGSERLSLVVDFGERGDMLDRAEWLDARLVP